MKPLFGLRREEEDWEDDEEDFDDEDFDEDFDDEDW